MPYSLAPEDDTATDTLRRIAREELGALHAAAETGAQATPAPQAAALLVHDLRKGIKRMRGLLRLVRPGFAPFAEENAALGAAALGISALRDAEVQRQVLIELGADESDPEGAATARRVLAALPDHHAAVAPAALTAFAEATAEIRKRARHWSLAHKGWSAFAPGLATSYAQCQARMFAARAAGTDEACHAWRSRAKHHWYHARLLAPIWPEMLAPRIEATDRLGETLGDHHDLAMLGEALDAGLGAAAQVDLAPLTRLLRARQAREETEAVRLGARLFAEEPEALTRRWGHWFSLWRAAR